MEPPAAQSDGPPGEDTTGTSPQETAEPVITEIGPLPAPPGPPTVEEVPLSDSEKEQLIEIAKNRALVIKDHLTHSGGLSHERVFICYSDVEKDSEGPPPRVELSI